MQSDQLLREVSNVGISSTTDVILELVPDQCLSLHSFAILPVLKAAISDSSRVEVRIY